MARKEAEGAPKMTLVERELERIAVELRMSIPVDCYTQLYAAQQALSWATSPGMFMSPYEAILSGKVQPLISDTLEDSKDCSAVFTLTPHGTIQKVERGAFTKSTPATDQIVAEVSRLLAEWEESNELSSDAARRIVCWILGHKRFIDLVGEYQGGAIASDTSEGKAEDDGR